MLFYVGFILLYSLADYVSGVIIFVIRSSMKSLFCSCSIVPILEIYLEFIAKYFCA